MIINDQQKTPHKAGLKGWREKGLDNFSHELHILGQVSTDESTIAGGIEFSADEEHGRCTRRYAVSNASIGLAFFVFK